MSDPLEARGRLTGFDALAASLEQSLADTARRGEDAAIIAALPLRPRPGLYLDRDDPRDDLLVLEDPAGPDGAGAIIGLALPDGRGGWYLGCITCRDEIGEADAGMCRPCREDKARREQHQAGEAAAAGPGLMPALETAHKVVLPDDANRHGEIRLTAGEARVTAPGWSTGMAARMVEHDPVTSQPKPGGLVFPAKVTGGDRDLVHARPGTMPVLFFDRRTGWLAQDPGSGWRLLPGEAATVDGEPAPAWVTSVEFRTSLGQPVDCRQPEAHRVCGLPVVCEFPEHAQAAAAAGQDG